MIIPTYNRASMIVRAVLSVLVAVSPGDEVIVVDDGSTDETELRLGPFADRIRYVKAANGGAGKARNRGLDEARFPLVAFLDSDDEWTSDRLLLGRRLLAARPDVLFCFSDLGLRHAGLPDQGGGLVGWHSDRRSWDEILAPGVWYSGIAELPPGRPDFRVHVGSLYVPLLHGPYVAVQTLLVRREGAGSGFRFAEDLPTYEDWECVARLARAGNGAYLDAVTAWQWGHDAPRVTDANELQRAMARARMIERVWGSDGEYLARDGDRVARVLREQRLLQAKWLLRHGRGREARAALQLVHQAPASYRLLASMPGWLTKEVLAWRLALRRAIIG